MTGDPDGASARVRIHDLLPALERRGIAGEVAPLPRGFLARRRLFRGVAAADVVVLHRRLLGEGTLAALRRRARALVLDLDDAVDERPFRLRGALRDRRRLDDALHAADLVVVGSVALRRAVADRHPRVRLVPPVCPWPSEAARAVRDAREDAEVRLVWTGSAPTLPYVEALGPVLADVARAHPQVRLDVVADQAPRLPPDVPVRFHPWSLETEAAVLAAADVGLYPLTDDPWSRGKCAYKVLLYMAHGLPTVASPHGGGRDALEPPTAGRVAVTPAEWTAALTELVGDAELRRSTGARALGLALARGGLEERSRSLAAALREATVGGGPAAGAAGQGEASW